MICLFTTGRRLLPLSRGLSKIIWAREHHDASGLDKEADFTLGEWRKRFGGKMPFSLSLSRFFELIAIVLLRSICVRVAVSFSFGGLIFRFSCSIFDSALSHFLSNYISLTLAPLPLPVAFTGLYGSYYIE